MKLLFASLFLLLLGNVLVPTLAQGQSPSHSYINNYRSSTVTHYYVGIGVEGEYGDFRKKLGKPAKESATDEKRVSKSPDEEDDSQYVDAVWKGYGIRNEIGVEFLKFLQFDVAHTSLNLKSKEDGTERLTGSRFEGGSRLTFYAPLGNLQLGGGFTMLRLDYNQRSESSSFFGSGYYYAGGYNYFLNSTISFFGQVRRSHELVLRDGGSDVVSSIRIQSTAAGFGFNIWL